MDKVVTNATVLIEFNGKNSRVRIIKDDLVTYDFDAEYHVEPECGH